MTDKEKYTKPIMVIISLMSGMCDVVNANERVNVMNASDLRAIDRLYFKYANLFQVLNCLYIIVFLMM